MKPLHYSCQATLADIADPIGNPTHFTPNSLLRVEKPLPGDVGE
jgi:hypothetical protein